MLWLEPGAVEAAIISQSHQSTSDLKRTNVEVIGVGYSCTAVLQPAIAYTAVVLRATRHTIAILNWTHMYMYTAVQLLALDGDHRPGEQVR